MTLIHNGERYNQLCSAQTQAKEFANQNDLSSDVQEVRENIKDLGDSVGHMASRQYERAQDMATDAIQETGDAIQRNPLMPELEQVPCQHDQVLLSLEDIFCCTGFQAVFGAKVSSVRLLVQIPGSAARMSRAAFTRAMASMPSFRNLMYTYVHTFLEQVLVSGACRRLYDRRRREDYLLQSSVC